MKAKILVLDDSPTIREVLKRRLTTAGFDIFVAGNFIEANRIFYHDKPDLVLIDVNLGPLVRGDKVLELYMAKSTQNYRPLLVLYSDMNRADLSDLAESCGADAYICKGDDVVSRVTDLLGAADEQDVLERAQS